MILQVQHFYSLLGNNFSVKLFSLLFCQWGTLIRTFREDSTARPTPNTQTFEL